MRHSQHTAPQVNAGSMADIAFLLLIFFLVTTTISADKGINRKLPANCPPGMECNTDIKKRNILRIQMNNQQQIMVDNEVIEIDELKDIVKQFVDNNGDNTCSYCEGDGLALFSEHPKKVVISLQSGDQTHYELFITIQDELTKAYYELRENYSKTVLGKEAKNLSEADMMKVKAAYPFIVSEAETK
jgi:biopolymer transport protein ExbD